MMRIMFRRRALRCALGLAALLAGCRQGGVRGCLDQLDAKRYQAAAGRCAAVFAAGGDPRAGAAVVRAHYFLGQEREALAWADRLEKAGKAAPGVWSVVGLVDQKRGDAEAAERAYRRDLAVCRAAGDHGRAADVLYRLFLLSWRRSSYRQTFLIASEAVQEATKAGDREREARADQALYTSLFEVGDLAGARRALEMADGLIPEGDRAERTHFLNNRGTVLAAERLFGLARHDFEQALSLGAGNDAELLPRHLPGPDRGQSRERRRRAGGPLPEAGLGASGVRQEAAPLPLLLSRLGGSGPRSPGGGRGGPRAGPAGGPRRRMGLENRLRARADRGGPGGSPRRGSGLREIDRRSRGDAPGPGLRRLKAWLLEEERRPFEALFRLQARSGRAAASLATMERAQARTFLDAFLHTTAAASGKTPAGKAWPPDAAGERMAGLESLLPAMSESPVAALQPVDRVLSALRDRDGLLYFEAGDDSG